MEQPEGTNQIDHRVSTAQLMKMNLRLWKAMKPRLRSTETLEGVYRRSFHLIRYFRPDDGVSQIRQGSFDTTVRLHDYAGPARMSPLLIS
jgi:hypothetical protein